NIANPHTASRLFGRNMVLPLAYDTIQEWIRLGWDLKADIFWRAARTLRGSNRETISILGSYPYPLEGAVGREIEHVLVFRKHGLPDAEGNPTWTRTDVDQEKRKASKLTLPAWMAYFCQVWEFPGAAKQWSGVVQQQAPYPWSFRSGSVGCTLSSTTPCWTRSRGRGPRTRRPKRRAARALATKSTSSSGASSKTS